MPGGLVVKKNVILQRTWPLFGSLKETPVYSVLTSCVQMRGCWQETPVFNMQELRIGSSHTKFNSAGDLCGAQLASADIQTAEIKHDPQVGNHHGRTLTQRVWYHLRLQLNFGHVLLWRGNHIHPQWGSSSCPLYGAKSSESGMAASVAASAEEIKGSIKKGLELIWQPHTYRHRHSCFCNTRSHVGELLVVVEGPWKPWCFVVLTAALSLAPAVIHFCQRNCGRRRSHQRPPFVLNAAQFDDFMVKVEMRSRWFWSTKQLVTSLSFSKSAGGKPARKGRDGGPSTGAHPAQCFPKPQKTHGKIWQGALSLVPSVVPVFKGATCLKKWATWWVIKVKHSIRYQ